MKQKGLFQQGIYKANEDDITEYEHETDFFAQKINFDKYLANNFDHQIKQIEELLKDLHQQIKFKRSE